MITELKRYDVNENFSCSVCEPYYPWNVMVETSDGDYVKLADIEPLIRDAMRAKRVGDAVDEVLAVYNSGGRMNIQWAMELLAGAMQEQSK